MAQKYRMEHLGSAHALSELTATIKEFNRERVPPPAEFTGKGRIECFFTQFERYARSLYKANTESYLRLLPQFLRGEARDVVLSFGYGDDITYQVVKERVIKVLNDRKGLGSNSFAELITMSREPDESLVCYGIRLQVAADNFTVASAEAREIIVHTLLLASLPKPVLRQLNLQFAALGELSLDCIIRIATVLETQETSVVVREDGMQTLNSAAVQTYMRSARADAVSNNVQQSSRVVGCYSAELIPKRECISSSKSSNGWNHKRRRKFLGKCHGCGKVGHTARRCFKRKEFKGRRVLGTQQCAFCETGQHALVNCLAFKSSVMQCAFCGSLGHPSFDCVNKLAGNCSSPPVSSVPQLPDQLQEDFGLWDVLPNDECASLASE